MPNDESVVSNLVFWTGLHRVEVIRFGKPVDEDFWSRALVPDVSWDSLTMFDWIEDPKGLKLHHLYVNWKERGAVDYSGWAQPAVPLRNGVLWWIAPGESLSFSADVASTLHKRVYGVMPSAAWVRNMPKGAKDFQVGEGEDQGILTLKVGEWVPERYVVVGNSRMEN